MNASVADVTVADVNSMLDYINWNSTTYVSKKRVLHYGNLNSTEQEKYYSEDPNFVDNKDDIMSHDFLDIESGKAFIFTKISEYEMEKRNAVTNYYHIGKKNLKNYAILEFV